MGVWAARWWRLSHASEHKKMTQIYACKAQLMPPVSTVFSTTSAVCSVLQWPSCTADGGGTDMLLNWKLNVTALLGDLAGKGRVRSFQPSLSTLTNGFSIWPHEGHSYDTHRQTLCFNSCCLGCGTAGRRCSLCSRGWCKRKHGRHHKSHSRNQQLHNQRQRSCNRWQRWCHGAQHHPRDRFNKQQHHHGKQAGHRGKPGHDGP